MTLPENGHLLRIFIGEADRHEGMPLHEWIVRAAREHGLAGATSFRGMSGFGASSRMHTARILRLSEDLPVVIEIVDTIDKIEEFLPVLEEVVTEGLATVEKVFVRFYRGRQQ
jgi:PII-like signaling protein